MRLEVDEHGYIYIIMPSGDKRYLLVDVPNCSHYGKLLLGEPIKEHKGGWQHIVDPDWCGGGYTKCTVCGTGFSDKHYLDVNDWRHCPNCGAKMVTDDE